MPGQYVNYRFSRPMMSVLRCFWTVLYLWMMMHASAVVPIVYARWNKGFFWDSRLPDKLAYQDPLAMIPNADMWILVMIAAVLRGLYVSCGYRLRGHQDPLDSVMILLPYMVAFVSSWLITTCMTALEVFIRRQSDTDMRLYCQLVMALLFKILVMANFTSVCLRAYSSLVFLGSERDHGRVSELNFGERLNLLFRN